MTTTPKFERELEAAIVEMLADDNTEPIEIRAARWANDRIQTKVDRIEAENSKLRAALEKIQGLTMHESDDDSKTVDDVFDITCDIFTAIGFNQALGGEE